jgi:hypothetical protein
METATRNTRYVRKTNGGAWEIVKDGHVRATGSSRTKGDAIKAARAAVRKDGGGEVLVLNRTGKVVESASVAQPKRRAA